MRNAIGGLRRSLLVLALPIVLLAGIRFGVFTATEGGAIVVAYSLLVSAFIYRELKLNTLPAIIIETCSFSGAILIIVTLASSFSWILAYAQLPQLALNALTSISDNKYVVMLLIVAILLVVGMFVETLAAAIISVPVLYPVGESLGFDPLQFAIVIAIVLIMGGITPPVGILLFVTASIARTSASEVAKSVVPCLVALLLVVVMLIFVPSLVTWLPSLE